MANEHIATYLNDHLAGSVVAIELLGSLEETYAGSPLVAFFSSLRADIEADRSELEGLMEQLGVEQSRVRKATAWVSEKITELKLQIDDPTSGDLQLLEALDALSIGILGKEALWRALGAVAEETPALQLTDYERLEKRAEEQRNRVEVERLVAAKRALIPGP